MGNRAPLALMATRTSRSLMLALLICVGAGGARAAGMPQSSAPDFTLLDQHGRSFTLSQHRGQPVVLFFGYANCPDVCPTILANLERARTALGAQGRDVVVAMITVDPKRDTPAALGRFVSVFDPSFLGLTGSAAQLARAYHAYHVRYAEQRGSSTDYLVEHTAFVYYIGREGRIRGFGTWNDSQAILEESLRSIAS
jgi:protein SCO1/2